MVCVVDRRVVNQKRVKNRYLFIMVESSRSKTGDAVAGVVVSITCLLPL